ncbi:phytosulfokines 2-like [Panicum virgatum]|uniref:Phytosulfokine n=1 Tax=Panicum virgatum TaxID=38727 RepID=A0A8T0PP69_PANVG|nr:phytosulfokines 2-like [Panicum virgatum]KAG2562718.1 hypothetical protein PVAP13_8KG241000 [Panicum virgatum]
MAPSSPPRRAALLLLSLLLLSAVAHAARESPAVARSSRGHAELRGQRGEVDGEEEKAAGFTAADDGDGPCGGGGGGGEAAEEGEECLVRRTLVAHTDYIYTQGGGHN